MLAAGQAHHLAPDPHPSPEVSRSHGVLPQAKRALGLKQSSLRLHLAGALCAALGVFAEGIALVDHPAEGLLFPSAKKPEQPTDPAILRRRARKRWDDAGLSGLGFHEGRHTFASIGIAAGLNAKTLSTYLGHATITITLDRYGHLMPGSEVEARALLDAFLDRPEA